MTTDEVNRRIEYAHEYSEEEVLEALKEAVSGKHGPFLKFLVERWAIEEALQ